MIGLKRGTVSLMEYQPEWAELAESTISELRGIFGECARDIQHIGSTAIRGIRSKPIIDIAVGVDALENVIDILPRLEEKGYSESQNRFSDDLLYVIQSDNIRTHQIHILPYRSEQWYHYVDFRDYMNAFPARAREYEMLKVQLAASCGNVQRVYTDGKQAYMARVLAEAHQYASKKRELDTKS